MATVVYLLCAATSVLCAVLLVRSYLAGRVRLLLWSALCFIALSVNNILLVVDLEIWTSVDLEWARDVSGFAAVTILLYGLIWESR